jgi:dihydropteroate synthase
MWFIFALLEFFMSSLPPTTWGEHRLDWGQQTYVMGIVNVTPDSFAGDGLVEETLTQDAIIQRAVTQAQHFVEDGALIIDVGGESTRPQAAPISVEQELARVVPAVRALYDALPKEVMISIDTYKAVVARQALDAGACMINDIWALRRDPNMAALASERSVPVVLMANMRSRDKSGYLPPRQGTLSGGQVSYKREIVSDVVRFLAGSIDLALAAGVAWERIIIDPGIGFGTTPEENLTLLRRLGELRALGRPILLGTSRKSTIGLVLGGVPASERLEGTAATVALGIAQGADIVRVHDVREMVRVVKMSDAIVRGTSTASLDNKP